MKCPHCQQPIQDNAAKLKQRRHQNSQCVDCAAPLALQEIADGRWRCFSCRVHNTELRRRRARARDVKVAA